MTSALDEIARKAGILPEYFQIDGSRHVCGPETAVALLRAMHAPVACEADAAALLADPAALDAVFSGPDVMLLSPGEARAVETHDWRLILETGEEVGPASDDRDRLPGMAMGVHTLLTEGRETMVIVSPPAAPDIRAKAGRDRAWGVTAALYGLKSRRNAGVGDYEDLAAAAEALAPSGAAFIGVNPLHQRGLAEGGASPYSPSSRTMFESRHIAVDRIPEFAAGSDAAAWAADADGALAAARAGTLVDYAAAGRTVEALRSAYRAFVESSGARSAAFARWRAERGAPQVLQSVYEALSLRHGPDWRRWPAELRSPDSPEAKDFMAVAADEIAFHEWRQWVADEQLADAQARAKRAGMAFGLYLDVAVGVRPGGAETWANRDAFAVGASLGAPPDLLNSQGQSWDLAPFSPIGLKRQRYAPFRDMLRSTMAHAGLIRIDHVIGFDRSFWAPENGAPGGYVRFPIDVLMALTRLEAARAGCLVVGEDLGTVPEGLRETLDASGLYGCAILPFEREGAGFRPTWEYRSRTLASFGTHDLPTLDGWWEGRDLEIRRRLGHLDDAGFADEQAARGAARRELLHLLASTWLLPEGVDAEAPPESLDQRLRDAVHILLARAASDMVAVSLDDIFGVREQQNVPGTVDEEPNWRRRAPIAVEEMAASDIIMRIGRIMRDAGRGAVEEKPVGRDTEN